VNAVKRVGNIKFDRNWLPMTQGERRDRMAEVCLSADHYIWVAGSTHPGEDALLLRVYKRLLPRHPQLRLILAPRQVERGRTVLEEARRIGLEAVLRTNVPRPCRGYHVLVLNTMGELERFYGLGRISFVGGSLVPFGGHNLLEPASFGCPVLFGPHTHNFVDMSRSLVAEGGGWRVADEEALFGAVERLLTDGDLCSKMGEHAQRFVQSNRGAVERIVRYMNLARGRRPDARRIPRAL
jgi:3-deoxy-D-manno-octulosonic-acid transferase